MTRASARFAEVVLISLVTATPGRVAAQSADGSGESYWGTIPAPADSVRAVFENRPEPLWETVILIPCRLVNFPLNLLSGGIGATVEYVDESGIAGALGRLLQPRTGPFGVLMEVTAGGLTGTGGGLTLEHTSLFGRPGNAMRLRGTLTSNGDSRAIMGLRFPTQGDNGFEIGAGYRKRAKARYFGIGPTTTTQQESYFPQDLAWAGASYQHEMLPGLTLTGDVLFSTTGTLTLEPDAELPITDRFAGALPDGFGSHSRGISARVFLSHEDVLQTGRSTRGGVRRVGLGHFFGTNDDVRFWTYRLELQQFFRLWFPHTALALRAVLSWLDDVGSDPVPFTRLLTNDDPDLLRGFNDMRWRDRGMMILTAEYRWPLWVYERAEAPGLDLSLLADVGQVFGSFDEIREENLTVSYGVGVRLLSARGFVLRVEYARSDENSVWRLRSDQVFQFVKRGLFHGRDPVPAR